MSSRSFFALVACLLCAAGAVAQPAAEPPAQPSAQQAAPPAEAVAPTLQDRLRGILASVQATESERDDLAKRLKATAPGSEAKALEEDLKRVERRLDELRTSFEELATGGATVARLEGEQHKQAFDWKKELEDVVRPLLEEVKRMTERPRTIERLRSERVLYTDRLQTAERAITRITAVQQATEAGAVRKVLDGLLKEWQSHRADAASRLQLIETQLQRLLAPEEEVAGGLADAIKEFFAGRGLNIALALAAFALAYAALMGIARLVAWLQSRRGGAVQRGRFARAGAMVFRLVSVVLSLFAAMTVLSIRGDWLILGLVILFLFGLVLTLRSSLPRYFQEMRVLLGMGGVREGERIIYRDIPWRIKSLNVFSTLHNPQLRGGTIRVPIGDMAGLQSRQFVKEEPWFPTREGDYVMLDGDVFGRVLLQTPELVQMQVVGSIKTWSLPDFLGQHPRNLSLEGFAVPVTFGVDYGLQEIVLTGVVPQMRAHIEQRLAGQVFNEHLKDLIVEFNEAASSALNIIIVGVFHGAGAEHYWPIRRFLQRCAVEACNEHGWTIPFEQLTVHLQGDDKARLATALTPS